MTGSSLSDSDKEEVFHDARYPAEEEADLLSQSNTHKSEANKLFSSARYSEAITTYDRALSFCPNYLDYEIAVLRSNISACHLKLEDWKAAVEAATASIDRLDRALPPQPRKGKESASGEGVGDGASTNASASADSNDVVELLDGDGDEESEEAQLKKLQEEDKRKEDIQRIRAKALMRRARARMELGGWANLQGAEEDYKELLAMGNLPVQDDRVVRKALRELPGLVNAAREKEVADMMGKLKDLGNGILKPFGLSTDNFKFVKDEKSGGYNMSFEK
ncbi:tetratricopeptide repeat protein 1 [Blastomyces gilchristii SLH14081]|uniref:Tetratricopeptide repeat protein 1 n=1 Tax=Blastomyces gilchristii (strain SLH14081) TaxID=559298 RepID=A0A179UZJ5_BLAGS|nr:tetratricopeptide repeat protein 1 [Blastomyces gilchristii SLH14081]OAT12588.1 tetratricopeptide repeat protein 1 [Blastomyces gilchristii SLH14081]